jgi:hypothetical protein
MGLGKLNWLWIIQFMNCPSIKFRDTAIKYSEHSKFLGVWLNKSLRWSIPTQELAKKLCKVCFGLRVIKRVSGFSLLTEYPVLGSYIVSLWFLTDHCDLASYCYGNWKRNLGEAGIAWWERASLLRNSTASHSFPLFSSGIFQKSGESTCLHYMRIFSKL